MKPTLFLAALAFLLTLFPTTAPAQTDPRAEAETAPPSTPPDTFLATQIPAWRKVLGTQIIANFRNATIGNVTSVLADQSLSPIVVDVSPRRKIPLITRNFRRVPLRTALYLISQDTGLKVDWLYAGKLPQSIRLY